MMAASHKFKIQSDIVFGPGSAKDVFLKLKSSGLQRLGWVIDENISGLTYAKDILNAARACNFEIVEKFETRGTREPDYEYLDSVAAVFRPLSFDAIIGIGGGSACDIAKALGILITNAGNSIQYRGMDRVSCRGLPVVLMPSTAGTGTEVTHTASVIDLSENKKLGINGRHLDVYLGVLDPLLTLSCPAKVTLGSGLDALVHAIEAVTAGNATIFSKGLGALAFKVLYQNFSRVTMSPLDIEARMNMLMGAHYAGLAMSNAGGGPASGISYPLGVHFQVPHGFAGGILLPRVIEMNIHKGYTGYSFLLDFIDKNHGAKSDSEKSGRFLELFREFFELIGGPTNFSDYKIGSEHRMRLVDLAFEERRQNLELNPVTCVREDIEALLEKVLV